ncbi:MAG: PEP-CTERM sorting domain-containing protein [Akkermansiaceae bacterium]
MKIILKTSILTASLAVLLGTSSTLQGATTTINANRFSVSEGVAFSIGNTGLADFLFNWTDTSGTFADKADPTLVLKIGQTYTFQRSTSAHPFAILDSSAASFISGSDGSFSRTTIDGTIINAAILNDDVAGFTADPAPTSDLISWTPTTVGDYYYTCAVTGHTGMTGKIEVIPEPTAAVLLGLGTLGILRRRRRA